MALTASATPTMLTGARARGGEVFVVTGYSTDASSADEIKAAPGSGKSILIDHVIITCNDADSYPWLQDEDGTVVFGRFFTLLTSGSVVINKRFPNPIKLASNKALQLGAAAAGNVSVYIEGRVQNDPS